MIDCISSTHSYGTLSPQVVMQEWERLKELSQQPADTTSDPRLQHVAVYMFKNHAPRKVQLLKHLLNVLFICKR